MITDDPAKDRRDQAKGERTDGSRRSRRGGDRAELILYATPTGALADACRDYFQAANEQLGPTTAQTYPPHCTLTGFFWRSRARVADVVAEMTASVQAVGPVDEGEVEVTDLTIQSDWVGLELTSPLLDRLVDRVVADHTLTDGDDALRPKNWLHLSLAYGRPDLGPYGELASERAPDLRQPAAWEVAVWERTGPTRWRQYRRPA